MSGGQAIVSLHPLQVAATHLTAFGHGGCLKVLEMELWERWSESSEPCPSGLGEGLGLKPTFYLSYLGFFCWG